MGLHHKLAHVLGGRFDLPHAETHTVLLPHVLAYNASAAPEAMTRIARALGLPNAPAGLWDLAVNANAPIRLADLGLLRSDLPVAAQAATEQAYPNPREVTVEGVLALLEAAYEGRRPG
jgi:maleylacetate reductase